LCRLNGTTRKVPLKVAVANAEYKLLLKACFSAALSQVDARRWQESRKTTR
jgi:hypothetical protein